MILIKHKSNFILKGILYEQIYKQKGLILMISSILIGGGVVAIAAACNNDKTSDPTKDEEWN